jgi:hypothetical protein
MLQGMVVVARHQDCLEGLDLVQDKLPDAFSRHVRKFPQNVFGTVELSICIHHRL